MHKLQREEMLDIMEERCERKLKKIYASDIPPYILARYQTEMKYLRNSDNVEQYYLLLLIQGKALETGQKFILRGAGAGSLLACLLMENQINLLRINNYYPRFVIPGEELFPYPIESVWGIDGKRKIEFEYITTEKLCKLIKCILQEFFPNRVLVPLGWEMVHAGYAILPQGKDIDDYPEYQTTLEDGTKCLWHFEQELVLLPDVKMECLSKVQDVRDMEEAINLVGTQIDERECAYQYDTFRAENYDFHMVTREDFFTKLIAAGIKREEAFKVTELIRKGKGNSEAFERLELPQEIKQAASQCVYLVNRAYAVCYTVVTEMCSLLK